jgi:hypothetical protein
MPTYRRPLSGGKWAWDLKGVRRVPYRLQGLIAAVGTGRAVYITEGEKSADALVELYCASVGSIEFGSWLPGQDAG